MPPDDWYLTLMETPCAATKRGPGGKAGAAISSTSATSATDGAAVCAINVGLISATIAQQNLVGTGFLWIKSICQ